MYKSELEQFYKDRRVLITGHTGFKGAWMCILLNTLGAKVSGYALNPPTNPSLFDICNIAGLVNSIDGEIRDLKHLSDVFKETRPEIVIHMAAQPIVRESYNNPVLTYETNVIGTVNVLECCRLSDSVKSIINVTTDKVYYNDERNIGFVETDFLDGYDPYSNSKSCSELVTHSYYNSFFSSLNIPVSTCRAGNVIGGGDFAKDRIVPDAIRAFENGCELIVRNPNSIRPYQHVIEPLVAYLLIAMHQMYDNSIVGAYNIGPKPENCVTTRMLADLLCKSWGQVSWKSLNDNGPHEANFLKLDCTKIKNVLGFESKWNMTETVNRIVEVEKARVNGISSDELRQIITMQIEEYLSI